jgi:hypothetical protein
LLKADETNVSRTISVLVLREMKWPGIQSVSYIYIYIHLPKPSAHGCTLASRDWWVESPTTQTWALGWGRCIYIYIYIWHGLDPKQLEFPEDEDRDVETLVTSAFNHLTRLVAQESFIAFSLRESFKSYVTQIVCRKG